MRKSLLIISLSMLSFIGLRAQTFDTLATFFIPDQLALGIAFDYVNNHYIISSGGQSNAIPDDNIFMRYDLSFNLVDTFSQPFIGTTSGFGIRDLAFDGTYVYGSYDADVQSFDPTTFSVVNIFTGINNPNRGLAVDTDGTFYSSNFTSGSLAHFNANGSFLDSCSRISLVGNAPYGLAVDNWTNPGGNKRLWLNTPSTQGGLFLSRYDYLSCVLDTFVDLGGLVPAGGDLATTTSGGLDITNSHPNYPGKVVGMVLGQNNPTAYVMLIDMTPIAQGINTLNDKPVTFNMYPNPAQDVVKFDISNLNSTNGSIEIYNALGQMVITAAIAGAKTEMNITGLNAGVYIARVVAENKNVVYKKLTIE